LTSLRQPLPDANRSNPASASGAAISANDPGAPAIGIVTGVRVTARRMMLQVIRAVTPAGAGCATAASPSAIGTSAMVAAMRGSAAAVMSTRPPPSDIPPERDLCGVDTLEPAGVLHGSPPVVELRTERDPASGLAFAVAPVPVVECQHGEPGVREPLRVVGDPVLAGQRDAVAHHHTLHHAGRAAGAIDRRSALQRAGIEVDVSVLHCISSRWSLGGASPRDKARRRVEGVQWTNAGSGSTSAKTVAPRMWGCRGVGR
jgi:hypothetical protein